MGVSWGDREPRLPDIEEVRGVAALGFEDLGDVI